MQHRVVRENSVTPIVKRTKKIGNQFRTIRHVLITTDRFQLTREMIGHPTESRLGFNCAIPCAATVVVKAVATRPRMVEGGVNERVACATKHKLSRIQIGKAGLLCLQPRVGHALQRGKIFQCPVVGGKRQQHWIFEAASGDQPHRVALGQFNGLWQWYSQAAAQSVDVLTDLEHFRNAALDHSIERPATSVEWSLVR